MKRGDNTVLDRILVRVRDEIEESRGARSIDELRAMTADAPPVRGLRNALSGSFGLIAEIKERSPSQGTMRPENVRDAPRAYEESSIVRAVSVLTNRSDFGMSIERLRDIRAVISKPVLRKEFIIDPYQVVESRAFGADAILLMTQRLSRDELRGLHDAARALQMDVIVECHTPREIDKVPPGADIIGINSRDMTAPAGLYLLSRAAKALFGRKLDLSTSVQTFEQIGLLPGDVTKVAESGIDPATIGRVRDLGYHAALIGTDLLLHRQGVSAALAEYQARLAS